MARNPSRYQLKALGAGAQHEVDEYKARSVWSTWWKLDPGVRSRFFSRE
jgi:hypothetical protein